MLAVSTVVFPVHSPEHKGPEFARRLCELMKSYSAIAIEVPLLHHVLNARTQMAIAWAAEPSYTGGQDEKSRGPEPVRCPLAGCLSLAPRHTCVYECIYAHTTYIHTYIHIYIYIHIHTYTYIHTYIYVYISELAQGLPQVSQQSRSCRRSSHASGVVDWTSLAAHQGIHQRVAFVA